MQQLLENPIVLYLTLGVVSLLLAYRSQLDEWAESNPRVAGTLKLMRSVGIDPWMLLQGLSLILRGRLPKPPGEGNGAGSGPGTGGQGAVKGEHVVFPPLRSEPPSNDRSAITRLRFGALATVLLLAAPACSTVRDVVWKPIASCSETPEQVFADVLAALRADPGDKLTDKGEAALKVIAEKYSSVEFVQCAVAEVMNQFAGSEDAEELRVRTKAGDFFERTGTRAE